MSVNRVHLIGNLGGDVETRYTPSGTACSSFSVATTEKYKTKDGNEKSETEWHKIQTFGRLAEICGEYLHKGSSVYIEGKIKTRSWEDKEGVKRYTTEIVASSMQMLGSKSEPAKKEQAHEPPEAMPGEVPFDKIPF